MLFEIFNCINSSLLSVFTAPRANSKTGSKISFPITLRMYQMKSTPLVRAGMVFVFATFTELFPCRYSYSRAWVSHSCWAQPLGKQQLLHASRQVLTHFNTSSTVLENAISISQGLDMFFFQDAHFRSHFAFFKTYLKLWKYFHSYPDKGYTKVLQPTAETYYFCKQNWFKPDTISVWGNLSFSFHLRRPHSKQR